MVTKAILGSLVEAIKGLPVRVTIPLFPLGSVLFPEGEAALKVFEVRYMDMVKVAIKNASPFGYVLIREGSEVGQPAMPEDIGTLATIGQWDMPQLGVLQINVRGGKRFRILTHQTSAAGLITAEVELLPDDAPSQSIEHEACAKFLRKVFASLPDAKHDEALFHDASWVSFRLTEILPFSSSIKQKMLALTDAKLRVDILHRFLREQQLLG